MKIAEDTLHFYAYWGNLEDLKRHIIYRDIDRLNSNGHTLLMTAVQNDSSLEVVKFLLDKGAEIDKKGEGNTLSALMMAIISGSINTVKYLIKVGADVNQTYNDQSLIVLAAASERDEIVKFLLELKKEEAIMYLAHPNKKVRQTITRIIKQVER